MQAHRIRRDQPGQRPPAVRPLNRGERQTERSSRPADRDALSVEREAQSTDLPRSRVRATVDVEDRPSNWRRVFSALLSSFVPGTGQLVNLRWWIALKFALPTLALVAAALLVAKLVPFEDKRPDIFGYAKGSLVILGDIVGPTGEIWDADQ